MACTELLSVIRQRDDVIAKLKQRDAELASLQQRIAELEAALQTSRATSSSYMRRIENAIATLEDGRPDAGGEG